MTNQYQTAQLRELDALHHLHPFTTHSSLRATGARVIVRGDGPYIWDSEGQRILDGMAGLWTCDVGYGRKELAQAAYDQMVELPFYNTFFKTTHPPVVALSRKLAELAPDALNQVFYGSSGSESNDTAIRLIRHYWAIKGEPKRRIIISRTTPITARPSPPVRWAAWRMCTSTAIRSMKASAISSILIGTAKRSRASHPRRSAFAPRARSRTKSSRSDPRMSRPSPASRCRARAASNSSRQLLARGATHRRQIWDPAARRRVITGSGRLGTWFGSQYYGIRPDLITFAKAATSGYIPLSGVIVDDPIADALMAHDDDFHHGYTFSGHPLACAVALRSPRSWSGSGSCRASRKSPGRRSPRCWRNSRITRW